MYIGNVEIPQTAVLAPMAGVTDKAFRHICKKNCASYMVGEMVSAKGLSFGSEKSTQIMETDGFHYPCGIQLFGSDPVTMGQAVVMAMEHSPAIIDINMGCPAPKIANNGGGAALMKDPRLASEIIKEVKRNSPVPVTVKFRKGWDEDSVNGIEFAKMAEDSGADAITIHGRTRKQMYMPPVDWEIIKKIKETVSIPVIGNGDVVSPESAKEMYDRTGCDLVMIGRGCLGNPWIFSQVDEFLTTGKYSPTPNIETRMAVMKEHITLLVEHKGEYVGMREARKHCGWYMNGVHNASRLRKFCGGITVLADIDILAEMVIAAEKEREDYLHS